MKRGKPLSVAKDEQKLAFLGFREQFTNQNDLPSVGSDVYKSIAKKLSMRITPKALYLSVKRNYNYFFCAENVACNSNERDIGESCEEVTSSDNASATSEYEDKVYEFSLSLETWESIKQKDFLGQRNDPRKPKVTTHLRRSLTPRKWTNIFSESISKNTPEECVWTFKKHDVHEESVTIYGKCKQCEATIKIQTEKQSNSITCKCYIRTGKKLVMHKSQKIRLTSFRKNELATELEHSYPIVIRNKILNSELNGAEIHEPAYIPSQKSLQNIKNHISSSKLYHQIVTLALWIMAFTPPYDEIVRTVSVYPFFVHYWTNLQTAFYKNFSKFNFTTLSIDATGSIFKKLYPPNDPKLNYKTKHLFLYVVVLKLMETSVPLIQMISENQTMHNIWQWLESWKSKNGNLKGPNSVITDDSSALIGAVVRAFTCHKSTSDYINCCFLILEGKKKNVPDCFLRLDTSHFVKCLYSLSCFKFVDKRIQKFYVKHIYSLKSCTDFSVAKSIIQSLITVALSKYDRQTKGGEKTKCELAREKLDSNRKAIINDDLQESHEVSYATTSVFDDEDDQTQNDFLSWFNKIVLQEKIYSDLCEETDFENMYYLPCFIDRFRQILMKLPLWSNLMCKYFQSGYDIPSSSNVESYFKNIKQLLLGNVNKLIRVDDFIMRHVDYLSGELKFAHSKYFGNTTKDMQNNTKKYPVHNPMELSADFEKNKVSSTEFPLNSVFAQNPTLIENWRNKTNCDTTKNTLLEKSKPRKNKNVIDFLSNGSQCRSGIQNVILNSTCAFDSVLHGLVVGYIEFPLVKKLVQDLSGSFADLVKIIAEKDYLKDVYALRTEILMAHCSNSMQNNIKVIDCTSTIAFILRTVLNGQIYSSIIKSTCLLCNSMEERPCQYVSLNELILADKGIAALQESAMSVFDDEGIARKTSQCCNMTKIKTHELNNVIFFDIDMTVPLKDVPSRIVVCTKQYTVFAVIEHLPGHFRVHCKQSNDWKIYDDLEKKVQKSNVQININAVLIMYAAI